MIDLCVVGAGDVVQVRHADILKELSDVIRVRSIVSSRQPAVDEVQRCLGYKVARFDALDAALEVGVDACLVAVPAAVTMDVASYLLRLRMPMYVEKPLAQDIIAAAKFVEEITEQPLAVVVGENFSHQERFKVARTICEECRDKPLIRLIARDALRRGARSTIRSDDELFYEHFVHNISSVRQLGQSEVATITTASKRTIGSITEFKAEGILAHKVPLEMSLSLTNAWSEDSYLLMYEGADTRISHNYDFESHTYTDKIEHYHGTEDLVEVRTIPKADCGMRSCWAELIDLLQTRSDKVSSTLINSLHDVQVREAIKISMENNTPVPLVTFS